MTGPLYAIGRFCSRWLPGWLDRLVPHISIEGEEYFAKRDADRAAAARPASVGAAEGGD